jgi:nickel and cobalt resistance protein CnrR
MRARQLILIGLIAFAAAVIGVLVGRYFLPAPPQPAAELHAVLHEQLSLDAEQERRLEALEASFAVRRRALELEMRAENARLADAIAAEHGNGPRVAAAVDASHRTMGQLQKETLAHIFAMRALLKPEQAAKFDAAVTRALTEDPR